MSVNETGTDGDGLQDGTPRGLPEFDGQEPGSPRPRRLRRIGPWLIAGATVIAWLSLGELPGPARFWTALLLMPLPAIISVQHRYIGDPEQLERVPVYLSSMLSLWLLASITAVIARYSGFDAADLGVMPGPWSATVIWTILLVAAGMAIVFGARALRIPETPLLLRLIPATRRERTIFAGLSITAGFCEELVFRGFLIFTITAATGSIAVAIAFSTLVFGWMHSYQGTAGAVGAGLLGGMLAIPVAVSGTVVPSMIAHAAIDVLAGIVFQRKLYDGLA